jgi:hypothetical protein
MNAVTRGFIELDGLPAGQMRRFGALRHGAPAACSEQ